VAIQRLSIRKHSGLLCPARGDSLWLAHRFVRLCLMVFVSSQGFAVIDSTFLAIQYLFSSQLSSAATTFGNLFWR